MPDATHGAENDALDCPHGDASCPCPDGDLCHYEGPDAWPSPRVIPPGSSDPSTQEDPR